MSFERDKKGRFTKNNIPWHKGKKGLLLNTGRTHFKKGVTVGTETLALWRATHDPWNKGRVLDKNPAHSKLMKGRFLGEKNPNWKGGKGSERKHLMERVEYKEWRLTVFVRDNYTCQICFKRGGILQADHIKPWSLFPLLRYEVSNGRTLCIVCHRKTDTYGDLRNYFEKQGKDYFVS